jgi:hypothetical protein
MSACANPTRVVSPTAWRAEELSDTLAPRCSLLAALPDRDPLIDETVARDRRHTFPGSATMFRHVEQATATVRAASYRGLRAPTKRVRNQ